MNSSRRGLLAFAPTLALGAATVSTVVTPAEAGTEKVRLNVRNFGARGRGRTWDDSAAFQSAVDALPEYGGTILVPASDSGYLIGNVQCGTKGVEWIGEGGPGQSAALGHGATELIVQDGTVGLTFGDGSDCLFRGSILRNLRFVANSTASVGGLLFQAVSNCAAYDVVCSNFNGSGSYGWAFNGSAGSNPSATMYNDLYACGANNCAVGIWGTSATGLRLFGGLLDANDNYASKVVPGTTGLLWQAPGDTLCVSGTRFQSYATHIDSQCAGTFISGTRHESFVTAIRIGGDFCTVMPGSIDNWLAGGGGTAIHLVSGKQAFVLGNSISSVHTRIKKGSISNWVIIDGSFQSG